MPGTNSTADDVRRRAASLLADDLIVYPIRHHSPACAWHLRALMERTPPSCVLIEGPSSFDELIPTLVHPEAVAPLALYSYAATARGRIAAYFPLCDHSPELVALRAAAALGTPARFIDLDLTDGRLVDDHDDGPGSLQAERHLTRSAHIRLLAHELGCRDHEELWEHLFESDFTEVTVDEHVARLVAYCELSRVDATDDEHDADGTTAREHEMAQHVRQALDARCTGDGPVLVVVGGYHAVAVHDLARTGWPRRKPSPRIAGDAAAGRAVVRYTFDRLDRLNGYASGMTSPAWFHEVWTRTEQHHRLGPRGAARAREEVALHVIGDVAAELRRSAPAGAPLPAVAGAFELALCLAELRRRPALARADVVDAIRSSLQKDDTEAALVDHALHRVLTGSTMGRLPPNAPVPPLVGDVMSRLRSQRLRIDDGEVHPLALELYRRPEHRTTSRLLHALRLLEVPFAVMIAGPDFVRGTGLGRLQERWEYQFTPLSEGLLVEASRYGSTLPEAVANRFAALVEESTAAGALRQASAAVALIARACIVGLHEHAARLTGAATAAIRDDAAIQSMAAAATRIAVLLDATEPLDVHLIAGLDDLLSAAFERACFLATDAARPDDVVDAMISLRALLGTPSGAALDADLFWSTVEGLQDAAGSSVVRGAAAGLRFATGRLDPAALSVLLAGHLDGLLPPTECIGFLRGLLVASREAAWQQPDVVLVLDRLLRTWRDSEFVAVLPELRLAFASMTPTETDRIAQQVAGLYGASLGPLVTYELDAADVQSNLARSAQLEALLVADGLGGWVER